ncbi:Z1 domain-containing protein [Spiroplasma culicicola]|uniref:Putative endonuclease Z1 domain-containing protein n=1 Tax=Spiroplasma culicicola AES-1 TaxID=1276246 RepID=W6A823_9MOLU|nr:Z1 domain-containing protein [Spiroplasma culicicola]AHI53040.1 hypothetical protein SCULI_v1c06990 [Spiroplasma culicicola AES-1]
MSNWKIDFDALNLDVNDIETELVSSHTNSKLIIEVIKKLSKSGVYSIKFINEILQTNLNRINHLIKNRPEIKSAALFGRVQSGKTLNSILAASVLYDNGYDIVIFMGGNTNVLIEQNKGRFEEFKLVFNDSGSIKLEDIKQEQDLYKINGIISHMIKNKQLGYKLFLPILKEKTNLENLYEILASVTNIDKCNIAILDDESDIAGVSEEDDVDSQNTISRLISNIIDINQSVMYIPISATPYKNIFYNQGLNDKKKIKYIVPLSTDENYTGFKTFHTDDKYIIELENDTDEEYMLKTLLKTFDENFEEYEKLNKRLNILINTSTDTKSHNKTQKLLEKLLQDYGDKNKSFKNKYKIVIFNSKSDDKEFNARFNFIIGGNLLSRGVTFENLVIELITNYNDKNFNYATMIQRCRWFGYRNKTLHVTRILMTKQLKNLYKKLSIIEDKFFASLQEGAIITEDSRKKFQDFFRDEGLEWKN